MPIGVRDMGFNTATNLFLMIGMTTDFMQPKNPKEGDMYFSRYRDCWRVFNGSDWIDVNLKEHRCILSEESIQE